MPDGNRIVGQEQIKEFINQTASTGKISHAYIICGEKGNGRRDIAALFAASIKCDPSEVVMLIPDKTTSIGVDDIRKKINNEASIKPLKGDWKVFIIPAADTMTEQAQNALLKTIEEPPEYVVIILIVENINALLPTILSRCVQLTLKPLSEADIVEYLTEAAQIPDYLAQASAVFSQGNIGKAVRYATEGDFNKTREEVIRLLKTLDGKRLDDFIEIIKNIRDEKYDINDYLDIMILWYRDVLLYKAVKDTASVIFREETRYIMEEAKLRSYENIEACIKAIDKAKTRINANVNIDVTLELLFLQLKEIY